MGGGRGATQPSRDDLLAMLADRQFSQEVEDAVSRFAAVPDDEWSGITAGWPELRTADAVVERMNDHAYALLLTSPKQAADFALVAARFAGALAAPDVDPLYAIKLEADAWRHFAAAQVDMGECRRASEAIRRAESFYGAQVLYMEEAARLKLIKARVKFLEGDTKAALREAEQSSNLFHGFCRNIVFYVKARMYYAWILQNIGRFEEAMDVYAQCSEYAERNKDAETVVHILDNVGFCACCLRDFGRAQQCYETALRMASNLGMKREATTIRHAMIHLLMQRGRYNEAISELYINRAEFLKLAMPTVAAEVSLRIVEILILAGRTNDVGPLCEEMIRTFTNAGLEREKQKAIAYLGEIAAQRQVTTSDVEYVRSFMGTVSDGGLAGRFAPPPPV
jgi:tetratricopeptide (TPR) repeat protein